MTASISTPDCHLYRVTDTVRGKFYIGKHRGRIQQGYWGSGMRIKRHIKKYGTADLKYEILVIASEEYIYDLEKRWLTEEYIRDNPNCLNLCKGGMGGNLGNAPWNKGIPADPEHIKRMVEARIGKPSSRKGVKNSEEHRQKIRITKLQNPYKHSEETKKKMSQSRLGVKLKEETRLKMVLAQNAMPKVECPHCHKLGRYNAMGRYRFD
jgi:hypothetical protein